MGRPKKQNLENANIKKEIEPVKDNKLVSEKVLKINSDVVESISDEINLDIKSVPFKDIDGKFLIIRVGSAENPTGREGIEEIQESVSRLFAEHGINNTAVLVTHHAVSVEIVR